MSDWKNRVTCLVENISAIKSARKPSRRKQARQLPLQSSAELLEARTVLSGAGLDAALIEAVDNATEANNAVAAQVQSLNFRQFKQLSVDEAAYLTDLTPILVPT